MTSRKLREAAAEMGRAGKGEAKRRGDAAHYAAIRLKRAGTVAVQDLRSAANWLRDGVELHERVAAWLDREADRRERVNVERERARRRGR